LPLFSHFPQTLTSWVAARPSGPRPTTRRIPRRSSTRGFCFSL
jgi:hypothetical protein